MRLLAAIALALVVAVHHGVPVLGHPGHAQGASHCAAGPCAPDAGGALGGDDGAADLGLAGACLAILAMAAAVAAGLGRGLRVRLRLEAPRIRRDRRIHMLGPPAHGPPRPLRPCVLQR
ncbi:MAG: hypothetical protein FJW92_02945 [Actinobacteria bacterium]|nr:hypothetical protein [Actinomycetota bacterium]